MAQSPSLINREDSPDEQSLPTYFTPVEEDKKSSLPDYFRAAGSKPPETERDKEKKKHTFFGDLGNAVGETKKQLNDAITRMVTSKPEDRSLPQRILMSSDPGAEPLAPSAKTIAGGGEASSYKEGFTRGIWDNLIRPLTSAQGMAGLVGGEDAVRGERSAVEPPIRPGSAEIPYRMGGSSQAVERPRISDVDPLQLKANRIVDRMDPGGRFPEAPPEGALEAFPGVLQRKADEILSRFDKKPVEKPIENIQEKANKILEEPIVKKEVEAQAKVEQPKKSAFVNPFEKVKSEEPQSLPDYFKPIEEAKTSIESPVKSSLSPNETKLYDLAREKFNMGKDLPQSSTANEWKPPDYAQRAEENQTLPEEESKPKAEFLALNEQKEPMYNIVESDGTRSTFTGPNELTERGIDIPETPKDAVPMKGEDIRNKMLAEQAQSEKTPTLADKATGFLQKHEDDAIARIKARGTFSGGRLSAGLPIDDLGDFAIIGAAKIARGAIKFADWSADMIKDYGEEIKPHLKKIYDLAKNKHSEFVTSSVKELYNTLVESKEENTTQQSINSAERAKRFSAFESVKEGGSVGAAKALSKLKGEYEKVTPKEPLSVDSDESNILFNTIMHSDISTPEKIRANKTLFTLLNGDRVPQKNELELMDKIFYKHIAISGGSDETAAQNLFKDLGDKLENQKKPDNFLTKLANFSSKSTRTVLGAHIPGTAISFHGFNEAIRNTMFGSDLNPINAAKRFADASYYLARPGKAQQFLDLNTGDLSNAIKEGGLRAETGDIGISPFFKGSNILTRGINYISDPKPLFGQVIPALKLKSYRGLLEQYEKQGIPHNQAAKIAGEATNNIYGGLNLKQLERDPNTQKLFRAAALAPDWLESNARLGKGMFDALKNPSNPKTKVYMSGIVNFLGSYVALNVLNAINNNGRFSFQNDVGHEFDVAVGKDSMGRTRYVSPYGTAMDMFRIPLEIGHAAVTGNMGKAFSDMRSRASEPLQFMTDMMTNTDYAGRALYDKTKFGKHIPALRQGANILGDAAGHFLPTGVEAGINFAQGKTSPEQLASQVLQAPMKYKFDDKPQSAFGKMRR